LNVDPENVGGRQAMVVSGDPLFRDAAAAHLRSHGWLVPTCESDGMRALSLLTRQPIDAILIIGEVARIGGAALKTEVGRRWPEIVVVTLPNGYPSGENDVALEADTDEVLASLGSPTPPGPTLDPNSDPVVLRLASLTPRERTILRGLGNGETPAEIAEGLGLSGHTVRSHLANLHHKLDVHRRVELVRLAAVAGLVSEEADHGRSGTASDEPAGR
jgi:DNA-binding CsgD family transcriptional regulator